MKTMKSRLSTKKNTNLQETKTISKKLSKFSFFIGAVVLLGITAPLWHIWADKTSKEEFIGFINLRIFLAAFGSYFAAFCFAFFVFWIKNYIDPKYKKIRRGINIVGGVFVSINAYFLLWVFNPYEDFPQYIYDIVFVIASVFIAYGVYLLNRFIAEMAVRNSHRNTKNLVSFIFRVRNKHYKRVAVKALYAEEYSKPLPAEDSVADNANEFEDDFYNTLEKVTAP